MTNPNDPAFPEDSEELRESAMQAGRIPHKVHFSGLTKREYFAAMAMQGLISGSIPLNFNDTPVPRNELTFAVAAVIQADALIAELNKDAAKEAK